MQYLIIICVIVLTMIIIGFVYEFNITKLKNFAKEEEGRLNSLGKKYPSNIDICKYILKKLDNEKVEIEEDKTQKTCLYIAITNKIIIADVRDSYTRIQTIAHECLHSVQNRKILLLNFIFSNIYLIYFIVTLLLGLLSKISNKMLMLFLMVFFSYIYYYIRSYLENDAMIKARFLAKEYMEEIKISSKDEIDRIIESYDKLNNMGIKMTNYELLLETIVKVILVAVVFALR